MTSGLYPLTRDGEMFGSDMNPVALIVTPPLPGTETPVHAAKVKIIQENLEKWMPEAPTPSIIPYTAIRDPGVDLKTITEGKGCGAV